MKSHLKIFALLILLVALPLSLYTVHHSIVTGYDIQISLKKVVIGNRVYSARGSSWSIEDNKINDIQDISISLRIPGEVEYLGHIDLHSEDEVFRVHCWELTLAVGITASDADFEWYGIYYLHDDPSTVTVYFEIDGRPEYSLLDAWVYRINETSTSPQELATKSGVWLYSTVLNGQSATVAMTPLQGGNVPLESDEEYPHSIYDALEALKFPQTMWLKCRISVTMIESFGSKYVAPSSLIYTIKIRIVHIKKIDPTQPEEVELENPTVSLPKGLGVPWWAMWIFAILVLIIFGFVMFMSLKATIAMPSRYSMIIAMIIVFLFFVILVFVIIPTMFSLAQSGAVLR